MIKNRFFQDADRAFNFLEHLAESNRDYLFRGHSKREYRLCTTLSRFTSIPHEDWDSGIDDMLERFWAGLAKLGIDPLDTNSRIDWMEYARHHGVPTPSIDFSYSPHVALFFAFNGVRKKYPNPRKPIYSVVYALDIQQIATIWAKLGEVNGFNDSSYQQFRFPKGELFQHGFPSGILQLIPFPGKYNNRMQHQFGALFYDTLNYRYLKVSDLEEFIEKQKEPDIAFPDGTSKPGSPTLIKVHINQNVFQRFLPSLS